MTRAEYLEKLCSRVLNTTLPLDLPLEDKYIIRAAYEAISLDVQDLVEQRPSLLAKLPDMHRGVSMMMAYYRNLKNVRDQDVQRFRGLYWHAAVDHCKLVLQERATNQNIESYFNTSDQYAERVKALDEAVNMVKLCENLHTALDIKLKVVMFVRRPDPDLLPRTHTM